MPLLNYTTEISAEKTVGEIEQALAKAGASAVMKEFDHETNLPCTLAFRLATQHGIISFRLPARVDNAIKVLNKQVNAGKIPRRYRDNRAQAIRVSWRIVKDWTLAQLALIELEQADAAEMFLPFATGRDGKTLYERLGDLKAGGLILMQ